MLRSTACLAALLALSACTIDQPVRQPPEVDACGATALQDLVGRSALILETMRFGTEVRVIQPGTAVTMDYNPARLNIEIDRYEIIDRVYCS